MKKQNIAILFGGRSSEYGVSLSSAHGVITHLDPERYVPILIGITSQGDWYHYTGPVNAIPEDTWQKGPCFPAMVSPRREDHALLVFREEGVETIPLDAAFPILHGKNGEDGTVQGLFQLFGIPVVGCGVLASALCMDKARAHRLVQAAGIPVPASLVLRRGEEDQAADLGGSLGFPLFVKPVKAGSSYGITMVTAPDQLADAVKLALTYDDEVILEERISGFETGCAVLGNHVLTVGEVDEIELSDGFFDFTEKYTLKTSAIHVPARISAQKAQEIKTAARTIYRTLGCQGFARVDLFVEPAGRVLFNEVNTIPGFTSHSRYPNMMKAAGLPLEEVLTRIIELAVQE